MKDFINKHPFITTGIIFGICHTIVRVVSILNRKSGIIVISSGTLPDDVSTTSENEEQNNNQSQEA